MKSPQTPDVSPAHPGRPAGSRVRAVLTALALVLGVLFAPGVGVLGGATDAHAVTKISHATATSMFRSSGITWSSSGG
ncbi:hypothetical protein ACFW55_12130, partial [Streptomyces sp. NPDC058745]